MNYKDESMGKIKLFTVGFTKKSAGKFFNILISFIILLNDIICLLYYLLSII